MDWRAYEIDVVRRYWETKTARQIAQMLPGRTRNMVISKASRIGLPLKSSNGAIARRAGAR